MRLLAAAEGQRYAAKRSHTMIIVKPIMSDSVYSLKAIRLRALQDSPFAFGSTYAKESQLSDAEWQARATQWNGERSTCHLAWDGSDTCGIVAGFVDHDDATQAHMVSMWVAPTHRGRGIGRLLVNAVIDWSWSQDTEIMRLMVTSNNEVAIRFYERLGFTKTGRTEPYPNDATLFEFEMIRPIMLGGETTTT